MKMVYRSIAAPHVRASTLAGCMAAAAIAFAAGCGAASDANNAGGAGGAGQGGTGGGAVVYPEFCDITGVTLERETVSSGGNSFVYRGTSSFGSPYDEIIIQSFQNSPYDGPTGPGRFNLGGSNYDTCGLCVLAKQNCRFGQGCEKTFYANAGTLVINSMGDNGMRFKANLIDVFFREVTIDRDTSTSLPVNGGDKWCAHQTEIEVPEAPTQSQCVPSGTGSDVRDNIASFAVQNCNGDWVDLHSFCGAEKAIRLLLVTGWCTYCAAEVPKAAVQEQSTDGLGLMVMLAEDQYEEPPTLAYCKKYADDHHVARDKVFIDFGWRTLFSFMNPNLPGEEILLPWDAVFDGDNMEYRYCDTCTTGDQDDMINVLLAD